jgi:L-alanine-DL-glutamate epimerase-like enolase superfamily enzyme
MWGQPSEYVENLRNMTIFFLETPFPVDSIEAYGKLTSRSPVRIAAGEHSVTRWEFLDLMKRGGVQVVQPYMTTCGGLTEAKRIVELAQTRGVLVCPGNWSTQVLGAATVHLAAVSSVTPLIEFAPSQLYPSALRRAIQEIGFPIKNGAVAFPTQPGIGAQLPDELVAKFLMG